MAKGQLEAAVAAEEASLYDLAAENGQECLALLGMSRHLPESGHASDIEGGLRC